MKTECTTLRNAINRSMQVVCSVYRLGKTVMGRLVSIKRNVNWPGLVKRSQEDLSAVGCRTGLTSHYKTKALAKAKAPGTDGVW